MGAPLRRDLPFVGLVVVIALVTAVGGSGATRNSRLRVGQPRTGAAGIRRTTREIMQLPQAHQPTHAVPKLGIHPKLQPNPNAPAPSSDKSIAAAIATSPKLAVGTSFTGATLAEEQSGAGGFVPPDSMGAVGPTQFLVGVNGKIKVLSKTGTVGQLNTDLNTFFSSVMTPPPAGGDTETTDPRVRYDTLSGKWFVTCHRRDVRLAPERPGEQPLPDRRQRRAYDHEHHRLDVLPVPGGHRHDRSRSGQRRPRRLRHARHRRQRALHGREHVRPIRRLPQLERLCNPEELGHRRRPDRGDAVPRRREHRHRRRAVHAAGRGQRRPGCDGGVLRRPRRPVLREARHSPRRHPGCYPDALRAFRDRHPGDGSRLVRDRRSRQRFDETARRRRHPPDRRVDSQRKALHR